MIFHISTHDVAVFARRTRGTVDGREDVTAPGGINCVAIRYCRPFFQLRFPLHIQPALLKTYCPCGSADASPSLLPSAPKCSRKEVRGLDSMTAPPY
ncbi:hypothetical protein EVAR_23116_1 [Eumeta japonica]|uniref:Uncharacterized protein n=1 Tax=Eumeta variegata TaxID=151549 RepID=A0A4C1VC72_EUMVA|nr:hypothetical protein EVAR_23116_1 [Eumeta japonica]